jgi:hypothetical protein
MSKQVTVIPPTFVAHIPTQRVKPKYKWTNNYTGQISPPSSCRDLTKLGRDVYLDFPEYQKRNNMIKAQASACRVKKGDKARPVDTEAFKKYGACFIRGIDRDWDEFCGIEKDETKVEWPENNQPFIVHAQPYNVKHGPIVGTANFFRPFFPNESEYP